MNLSSIVLASNNQGKLSEFQHLFDLANLGITLTAQASFGIQDADETGLSFIENAIIKARHASRHSQLPALADDSGLCVPILGNLPGIYSARYASMDGKGLGGDDANNTKLLHELLPFRDGTPITAKFVCVLALVRHADDPLPIIAQGEWSGEILDVPRGHHGFGYDPLFYVPSLAKSSAELDKATKNTLSHRGQALAHLLDGLKEHF